MIQVDFDLLLRIDKKFIILKGGVTIKKIIY